MPELKCTVQTCAHNKDDYCALDRIVVGGNAARKAEETCCDSFVERTGTAASNSVGHASAYSSVDCQAMDCMYNDKCACRAGKISVEGGNACQCKDTECATFKCEG